ncbi:class I SAM-dependent methyltransferase [Thiobaca trueperi]|uniref:Methyltransferase family protein n=1 Tax=Thiobaca trueperi TaxID=127458 RepID=A0A4R3N1Y9_9GAMM|nr:class I SAM-dependent methyltransferase [Thiobaca trueperi]TCT22875.1 methyltransferase family protein [Thiobaca trueperi]
MDKNLHETPEFFQPRLGLEIEPYLAGDDMQGLHHLARYHWAKQVLAMFRPRRVLDIACGSGYGSFILAGQMPDAQILGADYDPRGVALAAATYARPNLTYTQGNLVTWEAGAPGPVGSLGVFDAIVSFDTLEHLLHREIALLRIVSQLSPNGLLLFSTPCGHEQTLLNPAWEHHKIEYSYRDLHNLLRRFFKTVLIPEEENFPGADYWRQVVNRDRVRYLNKTNPVVCLGPIP